MTKRLLLLCFILLNLKSLYAQCTYTGTPLTQVGTANTFCVDNLNTITTATVNSGQYVVVNVVKGFNYTFSVGNVFTGINVNENLTVLDDVTNGNVSPATFASGASGATITWTATLSGKIKLLLSRGACSNANAAGGALTLKLNSVGNTQDAPTAFGTDQWIGHVYNWTGTAPPGGTSPTTPTATVPFVDANYVGYYTETSDTFIQNFGSNTSCFSVNSNGLPLTTIYTEQFAVRYRMRSTKTGCYLINFNGDDGIRVYVDGVKVFDAWKEQAPTVYQNVLVYLTGSSDLVFDYYENGGQNECNFSITPFVPSSNTITSTASVACSAVAPALLDGSAYVYNGTTVNPSITFQWQLSTDGTTYTTIAGATSEDYTPPATTTTTVNVLKYYRRIVVASAQNANSCLYYSAPFLVTTSPGTSAQPGVISGAATQCQSTTNLVYSIAAVINATTYTWTVPTGWTIVSGNGTNSITVTSGTAGQNGNISVTSGNGCGTSAARTFAVTVTAPSVAGTVSANQTICSGSQPANITLTGNTGTIQWQSSTDNITFTNLTGATVSPLTGATLGALTGTRYYRALVTNSPCVVAISAVVTVTVNPTSVAGMVSANQIICSGTSPANITLTGNTGTIQWQSSNNNIAFNTIAGATSNTLLGTTIGNLNATRYYRALVTSGTCTAATSAVVTVTVNNTAIAGTVSGNQNICSETTPANMTVSGATGNVQWQSSTNNTTFTNIVGQTSATLLGTTIGSLTATRYYRAQVTIGTCSTVTTATITVAVNPISVAGTVSANQSICTGTSPANISLTGNKGTIQWQSSTDNIAFGNITGATAAILTSATMGTLTTTRYYRALVTSGVCPAATTAVVMVTVSPTSVAGTVSGNQTICSGTTPASITLIGSVGSIQWQSSTNNSTFTNIAGATSATLLETTIGTLTAVTYFRAVVTSGACSSSTSAVVTVGFGNSTTWNGTAWSNGAPTSTSTVLITGDYNITGNVVGCSMVVSNNAKVAIASGDTVTLYGTLTVNAGCTFTLNNNSSLLQNSTAGNTGNIVVKRNTPALMRLDYVMWSSPVVGQTLLPFSPMTMTNRFYTYNPSTNLYVALTAPDATPFATGSGYLIRMPNNHPTTPTVWNGTFTGVPTNGTVNLSVTPGLYHAIGNPYPSAIDADDFIAANGITEALYFWRKTNNTNNPSYATYTTAGGVSNTGSDPLGLAPNGVLQVGQGFLVKPTAATVTFTNAIRLGSSAPLLRTSLNKSRFWLNLTSTTGNFCQTMVSYMETATDGVDAAIDGKYFNDSPTALTSIINTEEYTIQGKGLPFVANDTVSLGFKAQLAGDYTITLDRFDGLFDSNQDIYLKDNVLNTLHNLKQGSYTFVSESGVFNTRFEIVYQNPTALSQVAFTENAVVVYKQNQDVVIQTGAIAMASVQLYDISGRLLVSKNNINATEVRLPTGTTQQVLLVKITSVTKETITKKIVN